MIPHISALAVAGFGVAAFKLLASSLAWLLGPICACLVTALAGLPLRGNKLFDDGMQVILGVAVGATLTTTLLLSMAAIWPTLLMIAAIASVGVLYFQRLWDFDVPTNHHSAIPGGFQDRVLSEKKRVQICTSCQCFMPPASW